MFFDNFGELEAVQLLDSKEMHILYQKKIYYLFFLQIVIL